MPSAALGGTADLIPEVPQRLLVVGKLGTTPSIESRITSSRVTTVGKAALEADDGTLRGCFDCVVCESLLEEVPEPEVMLTRLRSLLAQGGRLIAGFSNARHHGRVSDLMEGKWRPGSEQQIRVFTRREIEKLFHRAHLVINQFVSVPGPGYDEWVKSGRPGNVKVGHLHIDGLHIEEAEESYAGRFLIAATVAEPPNHGVTSIVVVTHNLMGYTRLCVDSIRLFTTEAYELIFVDNDGVTAQDVPLAPIPGGREPPRELAEQRVAAARQSGDPRRLTASLVDLGVLCTRARDFDRATKLLEEAVAIARQAADAAAERDAFDNLGQLFLQAGRPKCAQQLFDHELGQARRAGDRYSEKLALGGLGMAHSLTGEHVQAAAYTEQALALARDIGDREHQAKLLWQLAIDYADLDQHAQALAAAQSSLRLLQQLGSPEAKVLAEYVERYRAGEVGPPLPAAPIVVGVGAPLAAAPKAVRRPSMLRMAVSALRALGRFVGSGLETAPAAVYQERTSICATCEHHTGLRCRVCGCFTSAKAALPHEECPLGKWPRGSE